MVYTKIIQRFPNRHSQPTPLLLEEIGKKQRKKCYLPCGKIGLISGDVSKNVLFVQKESFDSEDRSWETK